MIENQTIKDRLLVYIKYLGIGQAKFERQCGLSNGYINNSKGNFGASKIDDILKKFPELNRAWLMTGEGEMLNTSIINFENEENFEVSLIPLLPVAAQGGKLNDFVVSVKDRDCEKVVSPIRNADFAMPVAGDSMAPEYPNGSQVHIKKINEKAFIEWGKVYVLDTCNGTVIKRLVPSDKEDYIRCLSINTDPIYAPFEIFLGDIYGIYKVMLCLSIK